MSLEMISVLNQIKSREAMPHYLIGLHLDDILSVCKAWIETKLTLQREAFDSTRGNIWDCVAMDCESFQCKAGAVRPGTFEALIRANVLYPDGTYNLDFVNGLIISEAVRDNPRKH